MTLLQKYSNMKMDIQGNWYGARDYLRGLRNVVAAEITQMSSSAGDWDGYFIVKHGGKYHVFEWSQENNYPYSGFTLYTSQVRLMSQSKWTEEEVINALLPDSISD